MSKPTKKEAIQNLKQMIERKPAEEPMEKVFVKFCARTGVSMETCKEYYRILVETGEMRAREQMGFPERVYTKEEVKKARELIENGYKHDLKTKGSPEFVAKVEEVLKLIKTAGYYEFLRTYIRVIREIEGLSQLREQEAAIWFNVKALDDPVDDAGFMIQKTQQMKDFIEGRLYYETAEIRAVNKRIEFLEALRDKTDDHDIKSKCEQQIKRWKEQPFP
jgi:hypothetical protein